MSIDKSCLEKVIGLSTTTCDCIGESETIDATASLSGQYIDNLEHGIGLQSLSSIVDCGEDSIWTLMSRARSEAVDDFITQFMIETSKGNRQKLSNYSGFFGEKDNKGNSRVLNLKKITGFGFTPLHSAYGLNVCISSIGLGISIPGSYDIWILNCDTGDLLHTIPIEVVGKYTEVKIPISLPTIDDKGRAISYAFAYDRKDGNPMNYKFHCGCSGVALPNWDRDNYLAAGGFSVDDVRLIDFDSCSSKHTNGLIVCFDLKCDMFSWLCDVDDSFWCNTAFGRIMAKALVLITNSKLAQCILNSQNPNFYTLLGREALYGKRNSYRKLAGELITLLATEYLPEEMKNCLTCNPSESMGFKKREILV